MKLLRYAAPLAALLTFGEVPAQAGWDNVFQVACHNCRPRVARSSYYASAPAPVSSQSRTSYIENTYDEVITVDKPTIVSEPVNVQVKSYYFDPVTTYTTRRFRNADGCVEDVSVPCTRYVRKEECNTVTRYVERMKMVPTEVRRKVTERTPVTTITGPTTRSYSSDCDNCGLPPTTPNRTPQVEVIPGRTPNVQMDDRLAPQTGVMRNRPSMPAPLPPSRPFTGSVNARTTSLSNAVRGEVVGADRATPKANAKLVFLSDADFDEVVRVATDEYGNFTAQLPAGKWHVYVGNGSGRANLTAAVTVSLYDAAPLMVVSR